MQNTTSGTAGNAYLERKAIAASESAVQAALRLLEARFPRIAEEIRARWGKDQFDRYIDTLLIDDRGGRAGFPPDAAVALLTLSREHNQRFPRAPLKDPWASSNPRPEPR